MTETFLPVRGYSGLYEVGDLGTVRSLDRVVPFVRNGATVTRRFAGLRIKTRTNMFGYSLVMLCADGKPIAFRVHRLVMLAFKHFDGCETLDVNHLNGIKSDNRLANLEWATRSENHIHSYRELRRKHPFTGRFGAMHPRAIAVTGECIKTGKTVCFDSLMDAHREGYQASKISDCLAGKRSQHKGMVWKAQYAPPDLMPFILRVD